MGVQQLQLRRLWHRNQWVHNHGRHLGSCGVHVLQRAAASPAAAKPAAEPATSKPAAAPSSTKPATSEPAAAPSSTKPASTEPASTEPTSEPATAKPAAAEPAASKPASAKPAAATQPAAKPATRHFDGLELPRCSHQVSRHSFRANLHYHFSGGVAGVLRHDYRRWRVHIQRVCWVHERFYHNGYKRVCSQGLANGHSTHQEPLAQHVLLRNHYAGVDARKLLCRCSRHFKANCRFK